MMVMQQTAPGTDYFSILRPYFGQSEQHIPDVGLTVGHITATQTALPKNVHYSRNCQPGTVSGYD